jgi:hypothetical protein
VRARSPPKSGISAATSKVISTAVDPKPLSKFKARFICIHNLKFGLGMCMEPCPTVPCRYNHAWKSMSKDEIVTAIYSIKHATTQAELPAILAKIAGHKPT